VEELGYSWDEAGRRVTAAYLIVDYPVVLTMLRARQLHLSGLLLLSPVLDASNYDDRLNAAVGKSCAQIKLLVATWEPKPHVPTTVFKVKVDERPGLFAAKVEERRAQELVQVAEWPVEAPRLELPPPPRAPQPEPLDAGHYKLKLTIDAETYDELMRLRDLVRHSVPDGDIAKVISKAKVAVADGGETRTSNLRLYCRAHNQARNFTKMRVDAHSAKADATT